MDRLVTARARSGDAPARRARLGAVHRLVVNAIAGGVSPGAVVLLRHHGRVVWHRAYGWASVVPRHRRMRSDLVFDLASLTKPIATATAVLRLWETGALDIDRPVADYLPAFAAGGKQAVTIRHLLTHTSGLPAWIRLYLRTRGPEDALQYICNLTPIGPPGARVEYSDLGFIILAELVRLRSGLAIDRYVAEEIAPVLRWRWTRFNPPGSWRRRCVPTEVGNEYERTAAAEEGMGFTWREELIAGEVHDGNAFYAFGGAAGHAGLFSTAAEVGAFGQAWLDGGRARGGCLLKEATVAAATRDQTRQLGDGRGLGWRCRAGSTFMGARASARAFGHTGFTGTSLLIEPAQSLVAVLLTNRVHPRAVNTAIEPFRAMFHDAVLEAMA